MKQSGDNYYPTSSTPHTDMLDGNSNHWTKDGPIDQFTRQYVQSRRDPAAHASVFHPVTIQTWRANLDSSICSWCDASSLNMRTCAASATPPLKLEANTSVKTSISSTPQRQAPRPGDREDQLGPQGCTSPSEMQTHSPCWCFCSFIYTFICIKLVFQSTFFSRW